MQDNTVGEYLTASEACDLLGVKPATLYAYVSRGQVRSYKQGIRRQRLYLKSELEALLQIRGGSGTGEEPDLPEAASWVGER